MVKVRFGLGLFRLGFGPVRDGLRSFRILVNKLGVFGGQFAWRSVVLAVSWRRSVVVYRATAILLFFIFKHFVQFLLKGGLYSRVALTFLYERFSSSKWYPVSIQINLP